MALPIIRDMYFILTHQCNLECKYCFVSQDTRTMSCETAFAGVDYLAKCSGDKKASINFFGGEPLLRWSQVIVPTVLYGESKYPGKFKFNITTNCVLLDKEKSDFIINHNMGILTSFDGCKETQDYNRPFHNGEGSFDVVYNNIMQHKANGGKLDTMRATVHPDTVHLLYQNYLQAIEMGYKSIFFMPDSFSTFTEEQAATYKEELYKIAEHFIAHWKEYKRMPIDVSNISKDFPQAMEDILRIEAGLDIPTKPHCQKCGYGQNQLVSLAPTGDIFSCQQFTSNKGPDSPFWLGNLTVGISEERRVALGKLFDSEGGRKGDMPCEECSGRSICKGGCVATNYLIHGYMRQNSPTWCMNMRTSHEVEMYIVNALRDDAAFQERLKLIAKRFYNTVCAICQENQQ